MTKPAHRLNDLGVAPSSFLADPDDRVGDALVGPWPARQDYMLRRSSSSMYYLFPRSTTGADFVIGASELDTRALADRLSNSVKFDTQLSFELIGGTVKKEIQIVGTPFRIEQFELTDQTFDQYRFARRRKVSPGGMEVWIFTVEYVSLQKLICSRLRDLDDLKWTGACP
ncbi:hypothetical protein [Crateriforma conspicua]|nr:hypothetical protein [Crateriforma conspicua]